MYLNLKTRFFAWIIIRLRTKCWDYTKPRFIVCTGTSGKTLSRYAITSLLRHNNIPYISPLTGYTNEIGILLAAVGINNGSLWSWNTWRTLLWGPYTQDYVCIELGADFRSDIPWFLRRFTPFVVVYVACDRNDWYKQSMQTKHERISLFHHLPKNGFGIISESVQALHTELASIDAKIRIVPDYPFITHDTGIGFGPQRTAIDVAQVLSEEFGCHAYVGEQSVVSWPENRLTSHAFFKNNLIISDTYKAIPFCTFEFLKSIGQLPYRNRILVLGEPYPLPADIKEFVKQLADYTKLFTTIILVCSSRFKNELLQYQNVAFWTKPQNGVDDVINYLRSYWTSSDTLIAIKGSQRAGFIRIEKELYKIDCLR